MTNGITNDEANVIGNFIDAVSKLNMPCVSERSERLILIKPKTAMDWIYIKREVPYHDGFYYLKTSNGRELIGKYSDEFGIFMCEKEEDGEEYEMGWKNNGENPELVTHYRKANLYIQCKMSFGD